MKEQFPQTEVLVAQCPGCSGGLHSVATGMGRESWSRSTYSHGEESYNLFSNVGGGLHDVAEIVMQLVSGRGRGNAAFWTSASSFLDLEVQSGVELFFHFDGSRASRCGERPAAFPLECISVKEC